jgi:hypothetical protein
MLTPYVDGIHTGTGFWAFEKTPEGTRTSYRIDLELQGWFSSCQARPS